MQLHHREQAGATIFEVLMGATILLIVVTSLYALYGDTIRASRAAAQYGAAERYLLGQMDQLRNCGWLVVTGSMSLPSSLLVSPTSSTVTVSDGTTKSIAPDPTFSSMGSLQRTLSVYATPSSTTNLTTAASSPSLYYTVTQTGDSTTRTTTFSSNYSSLNPVGQPSVGVNLRLQWTFGSKTYTKQCSAILSQAQANSQ